MREPLDATRLRRVMEALARAASGERRIYLVGGATALLGGWRASTIDVDLVVAPEDDALLRAIPAIKEALRVNVELASPADFIPVPEGWEERSPFVGRIGRVAFHHFDLYAQALAKIERGHQRDMDDVQAMLSRGLVTADGLRGYFERIAGALYRYPAVHAPAFRRAVEEVVGSG